MRRTMVRLAPFLHLTRVTSAFAAVANVWFVILWTRASAAHESIVAPAGLVESPLWFVLLAGAANALGLFSYAAALNDLLDYRRDRKLHPGRPLPAGKISLEWAIVIVAGTLMLAVIGAGSLGREAVLLTVLISAAVLFFHAAGKFVPGFGLVLLGLIYAGHMVVPNLYLVFVWPVWLVMTHSLAVGGLTHALARRVPRISRRAVIASLIGWTFWTLVMMYAGWWRSRGNGGLTPHWVHPIAYAGPAVLALGFALMVYGKIRQHGRGPRAADKIARYGAMWLALYACAWMLGQGYRSASIVLIVLTAVGFLGMTILREIYAAIEHPVAYRR